MCIVEKEEEILFETRVDLGGETLVATVHMGDACATFRLFGIRGGLRGMVTVPAYVLADCLYAIYGEGNRFYEPPKAIE